jgi:hypothetical protein
MLGRSTGRGRPVIGIQSSRFPEPFGIRLRRIHRSGFMFFRFLLTLR